ncbi:unnamed protein product, partial [marine sediment metagenome]
VRRWLDEGIQLDGELIRLQFVRIDERRCIKEQDLNVFISERRRTLENRERRHEKFTTKD